MQQPSSSQPSPSPSPAAQAVRHTAGGTIRVFLAEALLLPTGLITAAYLTRNLGPAGYGLFTLAAMLTTWIAQSTASLFSRTTIKFVSEADDWCPVGTTVLRLYLAAGLGTALLLWAAADPLAALFGAPKLPIYLRLFAAELLLFSLVQAHRGTLIGTGQFRKRALASAIRWPARLLLIVAFVFGPDFALTASLLAVLIFSAVAMVMISVATVILIAAGQPQWTFALTGPLLALALAGYVVVIPRLGPVGAALVTTILAVFGALGAVAAVQSLWGVTLAAIPLGFALLGEFSKEERAFFRTLLS